MKPKDVRSFIPFSYHREAAMLISRGNINTNDYHLQYFFALLTTHRSVLSFT